MNPILHDEQGNEIKPPQCKCGKMSDTCIMGVKYHEWICNDCLYGKQVPVSECTGWVYNPPDTQSDRYKRAKIMLDGLNKNENLFAEYGGTLRCMTSDGRNVNMAEELNRLEAEKQSQS